MGRRGPPPKPTHIRLLEGNPSKRPINRREPQPEKGAPPCPRWLTAEARVAWKRITALLLGESRAEVDAVVLFHGPSPFWPHTHAGCAPSACHQESAHTRDNWDRLVIAMMRRSVTGALNWHQARQVIAYSRERANVFGRPSRWSATEEVDG